MGKINNIVELIDTVEEEIKEETKTKPKAIFNVPDSGSFDAIIIGGGPAGITAGVYLGRKLINTLLISPELGGQVLWTSNVENYPGYSIISGWELAANFKEQLMLQKINLRIGDSVVDMELTDNGGFDRTEKGSEYSFKSVIVATGKKSKVLNVPGEKEFFGKGVTYCATCDGPLYRGEKVAVIGGGNSALTAANDLLSLGCTVVLVNFLPGLQADEIIIEKIKSHQGISFYNNHKVDKITGDKFVSGIKIHDRETEEISNIDVSGVFIEIGLIPNSSFTEGIVEMSKKKEILVDCRCQTNVQGIFAAGDVTNVPNKQIIIAAGEGAKAALSLREYLLKM